ncbi:hypothetical protein RND71_015952 [Anisodus tanguticus]|uniref:Uncharacterized protein n=1 Tax=Anisodus tanguticus TaxID=243964 RepID=A0AAE1S7T6_9SOLA|nr:hypothetical protein RND71_015952 [Anisodus tanguticus]
MAILVFVHHFLFSDANNHSILNKDFDIVESGQYQRYAWGTKVFEDIFRTMRGKLRAKLMMYRLRGLPLAFQNMEQHPHSRSSTSASPEDLKAEINELRLDLGKLTRKVTLLNDYVISSFERLFKLFDPKATKEKGDNVSVSEHFDDHKFIADVPEGNMPADEIQSNIKPNEGVTDGVCGQQMILRIIQRIGNDDELTDEVLAKLNMFQIESEELTWINFPGKWDQSPFVKFGYDISSTSKSTPKRIFEEKYPFVNNIDEFDPYSYVGRAFSQLLNDGMDSSQSVSEIEILRLEVEIRLVLGTLRCGLKVVVELRLGFIPRMYVRENTRILSDIRLTKSLANAIDIFRIWSSRRLI